MCRRSAMTTARRCALAGIMRAITTMQDSASRHPLRLGRKIGPLEFLEPWRILGCCAFRFGLPFPADCLKTGSAGSP